ncbi:MAG TPA: zf-HC2 domain-containing protein [Bryobacteraceae bacterium]|nr:zf-HC2 domain-containing protein [Bryobacteraceae bacterium]
MRCFQVRRRLHRFLDRELDPEASRRVEAHLCGCIACRQTLADLVHVKDLLEEFRAPDVRDGFAARALGSALIAPAQVRAPGTRWFSAMAAVCAILFLTWAGFRIGEAYSSRPHQDVIQSALASPVEPDF